MITANGTDAITREEVIEAMDASTGLRDQLLAVVEPILIGEDHVQHCAAMTALAEVLAAAIAITSLRCDQSFDTAQGLLNSAGRVIATTSEQMIQHGITRQKEKEDPFEVYGDVRTSPTYPSDDGPHDHYFYGPKSADDKPK
jgi:hypothetical protein